MSESAERESSADNDRCVLNSWHEWDVTGTDRRIILCVETALELRPGHPGFDPAALEVLIRDGNDMCGPVPARSTGCASSLRAVNPGTNCSAAIHLEKRDAGA